MIRELTLDDYTLVDELGRESLDNFDVHKLGDNEKGIVYEIDGKIVGFLIYISLYEVLEVLYIVVDSNYRRLNIGTKMINYLFDDTKIERSILEVKSTNESAIKFYESLGYKIIRVIKNYYQDVNGYSMERVK